LHNASHISRQKLNFLEEAMICIYLRWWWVKISFTPQYPDYIKKLKQGILKALGSIHLILIFRCLIGQQNVCVGELFSQFSPSANPNAQHHSTCQHAKVKR